MGFRRRRYASVIPSARPQTIPPITNHHTSGTTVLSRNPIIINPRPPTPSTGLLRLTLRGVSLLDTSHSATMGSMEERLRARSEEHTTELQSPRNLVSGLLLGT